jgi:hypothetical protein
LALGGEFTIITSLLIKFDFAWEIQQITRVAGWGQPSSKAFSCRFFGSAKHFRPEQSEQCSVVTFFGSAKLFIPEQSEQCSVVTFFGSAKLFRLEQSEQYSVVTFFGSAKLFRPEQSEKCSVVTFFTFFTLAKKNKRLEYSEYSKTLVGSTVYHVTRPELTEQQKFHSTLPIRMALFRLVFIHVTLKKRGESLRFLQP